MAAEEQQNPSLHLDLTADPYTTARGRGASVKDVRAAVTQLLSLDEPVETLEGHPLVRKVLHKYARPKLSQGFAHMEKLGGANSKCEKVAEMQSVQGTPPTVRLCTSFC